MTYENTAVTITSAEAAIIGTARKVTVNWKTFETFFSPVNNLNHKYQIVGKTSGKCKISNLELPIDTAVDLERIRSAVSVGINITKDGVTLLDISTAFKVGVSKQPTDIVEGKSILVKNIEYDILV